MSSVVQSTRARCLECGATHEARIEQEGAEVYGTTTCPRHRDRILLSKNAELFRVIRAKSRCLNAPERASQAALISLLPVTDDCNFRCPICYADAEPRAKPSCLALPEITRRAREARKLGARTISITGGEPTLHPDLPEIIRRARALGFRVLLVTNGLRLGREPGLALQLSRAGLFKVKLQLDALDPAIHEQIRGNSFVEEKLRAAKSCVAAGLRLGTIATVTRLNLREVGSIVQFGLSLAPMLNTIVFQAAAPVGRFEFDRKVLVDKEEILLQLLASNFLPGASLDDVWPLPHVEPWGMRVHPDCGVNLVLFWNRGEANMAREVMDLEALQDRLHALGGGRKWFSRNLAPLMCILRSARRGRRTLVLHCLAGFLFRPRHHGAVVIGVGGFCSPGFLDEQRLNRCATVELRAGGGVRPCLSYAPLDLSSPGRHTSSRSALL